MRGADSRAAYSLGSAEWDGSVSGPLSDSFSLCSSLSFSVSLGFFLFLSPSVRESNDHWSAPRTPPGIPHGDKLTMGDKASQNCHRDEEVLNVPFSPQDWKLQISSEWGRRERGGGGDVTMSENEQNKKGKVGRVNIRAVWD